MRLKCLAGAASALALSMSVPASAQRQPSLHVRCDGMPDNVGTAETAARLVGAVTLLGIFAPPPESPDRSARLHGGPGVDVCTQAVERESNDTRRAQLLLARALHRVEAETWDEAIADVRAVADDRPQFAATDSYRRSLGLAALEIEALALVGAGRIAEARDKAFEMADAAPYDVLNQLRAHRFVRLAPDMGERERRYYARLLPLYPLALFERAAAFQMAGDFAASAADYETALELQRALGGGDGMLLLAHAALAHALAGDEARAAERATASREALLAKPNDSLAASTTELLDLYHILRLAADGRAAEARLLFASRTSWVRPHAGAVAEAARRLSQGAPPAELTGGLDGDPERFRQAFVEAWRRELLDGKNHFGAIRPFRPQRDFDRFSANVWRQGRSRYLDRAGADPARGRRIAVGIDGYGVPASYALLLHAALAARAEGKSRFMLLPTRTDLAVAWVRFGEPGDAALVDALSFDAATVIRDLAPVVPRTVAAR